MASGNKLNPQFRASDNMGDMADMMADAWDYDDSLTAADYLGMSDNELRAATSMVRSAKLKSIRAWPHPLSEKQRYCLAAWLAERDMKYA